MKYISIQLLSSACVFATAGMMASPAHAIYITVTSGANTGEVLFDSNGFENDTVGVAPADANATGTYRFNQPTAVYATTGAATQSGAAPTNFGAPAGAFSGDNYLTATRTASGALRAAVFTRTVDASAESFRVDWADWGYGKFTAYSLGEVGADGTAGGDPDILNAWGVHSNGSGPNSTRFVRFGDAQSGGTITLGNTEAQTGYDFGEWNVMSYEWNHLNAMGTLTIDGTAHTFAQHDLLDLPNAVGQFFFRPNTGGDQASVYVDSVPEPGSLALLGAGGLMMLTRGRRRD